MLGLLIVNKSLLAFLEATVVIVVDFVVVVVDFVVVIFDIIVVVVDNVFVVVFLVVTYHNTLSCGQ